MMATTTQDLSSPSLFPPWRTHPALLPMPIVGQPSSVVLSPARGGLEPSPLSWIASLALLTCLVAAICLWGVRVRPSEGPAEKPLSVAIVFESAAAARTEETPPRALDPEPPSGKAVPDVPVAAPPSPEPNTRSRPLVAAAPATPRTPPQTPTRPQRPPAVTRPSAAITPSPLPKEDVSEGRSVERQTAAPVAPPVERAVLAPRPIAGALGNPKPIYPAPAVRRGWQGAVLLRVSVSPEGRPLSVRVLTSSGYGMLDDAARQTVLEKWRFEPAIDDGVPVGGDVNVPIEFRLAE